MYEHVICLSHMYPCSKREEQPPHYHWKAACSPVITTRKVDQYSPVDWEAQGNRWDLALVLPLGELFPTVDTGYVSRQLPPP